MKTCTNGMMLERPKYSGFLRGVALLKFIFPVSFKNLPKPIIVIGFFYLLTPVFSYMATALTLDKSIADVWEVIKTFNFLSGSLNTMALLLGLGILGVKRWGYVLFLTFNFILIGHGSYLLYLNGFEEKFLWNMLYTLIPFVLIAYFLNKEISTPYLTLIPRGFRNKWRIEIPISGTLTLDNNVTYKLVTMDISPSGCLAKVEGNIPENCKGIIRFDFDGQKWESPVLWVREEDENQGFKFMFAKHSQEYKVLDKFLSTKLLPRYTTTRGLEIEYNSKKFSADVVNISEGGLYVSTKERIAVGEHFSFQMKLKGFTFTGIAKVSWENHENKFDKPEGFGASYVTISSSLLYSFILFLYEKVNNFNKRDR